MRIIGAGLAGLLSGNVLRRFQPEILEAQSSLPNNHSALLRFRTEICSKATGVPFRKVEVHKAIMHNGDLRNSSTIALNNAYSLKVTGQVSARSIINVETSERFVAPDNFISQMAASVSIRYGQPLSSEEILKRDGSSDPIVSTIPMPAMMKMVGWENPPPFDFRTIWSVRCRLKACEVYQTIYYPDRETNQYRASITGDLLIIECLKEPSQAEASQLAYNVLADFGIDGENGEIEIVAQKYGKLTTTNPHTCRQFILFLTDRYRIYSLGRFAVWKQILLDDVCKDISIIERLIEYRGCYQAALEQSK